MTAFLSIARALVLAPHPDDEVLGCGGTIARLAAEGAQVHVLIPTRGFPPLVTEAQADAIRAEARAAHAILKVAQTHFLDLPAARVDTLPHADVNKAVGDVVREIAPDTLIVPHNGDIHLDHQLLFTAALVAARPAQAAYPLKVWAYETLSETNWNAPYVTPPFVPNLFVDITETLPHKLAAMRAFASQVRQAPHERSVETLEALARLRGATVHRPAAEAFVSLRIVV